LKVRLTPHAEHQLAALPEPAASRRFGVRGWFDKSVMVRPRHWSYRISYEPRQDDLVVLYLDQSESSPCRHNRAGCPEPDTIRM
jgi:hypothetical protein